jgi:hypothetical protein
VVRSEEKLSGNRQPRLEYLELSSAFDNICMIRARFSFEIDL